MNPGTIQMPLACIDPYGVQLRQPSCCFHGAGMCADYVSTKICNSHSKLFGIIHKSQLLTTKAGARNVILAYMYERDVSIPIFVNERGEVLTQEIYNFVDGLIQRYPQLQESRMLLFQRIACMMDFRATIPDLGWDKGAFNCGWSSCEDTQLALHKQGSIERYMTKIPALYQILLYHTEPAQTVAANGSMHLRAPNLAMVCDNGSNEVVLKALHDDILYWTNNANCVASPIVVSASCFRGPRVPTRSRG